MTLPCCPSSSPSTTCTPSCWSCSTSWTSAGVRGSCPAVGRHPGEERVAARVSPSAGVWHSHDTASLERSQRGVLCPERVPEAVPSLPSVLRRPAGQTGPDPGCAWGSERAAGGASGEAAPCSRGGRAPAPDPAGPEAGDHEAEEAGEAGRCFQGIRGRVSQQACLHLGPAWGW